MSEMLSQDEIDALLRGSIMPQNEKNAIDDEEIELIKEVSQLGMNVFANYMINSLGKNTVVKVKNAEQASAYDDLNSKDYLIIEVDLDQAIQGKKLFLFKVSDVISINDMSIGGNGVNTGEKELKDIHSNIMLAHMQEVVPLIIKNISDRLNDTVLIQGIKEFPNDTESLNAYVKENEVIRVDYYIEIGDVIKSEFIELIPLKTAKSIKNSLLMSAAPSSPTTANGSTDNLKASTAVSKDFEKQSNINKATPVKQPVAIRPVEFPSFDNSTQPEAQNENIEFIMDVPLQISVELGRSKKSIKEILDLNIGSVVELNKLAEDYVDVFVNDKLIARGEVVVVDENFGIRIMELYTGRYGSITEKI